MPLERICKVQPLGVSQNVVFVVDIDVVDFRDLKAGMRRGTGTKKTHFRLLPSGSITVDMLNAKVMLVNQKNIYF